MPTYEEYIEAIKPLWDSHWLTNMGKYHKELEKELREYLDVPQISLMVNGHMALDSGNGFPGGRGSYHDTVYIHIYHACDRAKPFKAGIL